VTIPANFKDYFAQLQRLTPDEVIPKVVGLEVSLDGATTNSDTNGFVVDKQRDFIITSIRGYVRNTSWATEVALAATVGTNVGPRDRLVIKANNCVVELRTDREEQKFVGGLPPVLAAFMAGEYGGAPLDLSASPIVVPGASVLTAKMTLKDVTAAIIGAATVYGLAVSGLLVPATKSK
jgi:hypothetical protein